MMPNYSEIYGEEYFTKYECGAPSDVESLPYGDPLISVFLSELGKQLVENIQFVTAIDVGCATGILVDELRANGKIAYGIDVSDYALSKATHCQKISIVDTFMLRATFCRGLFDIATCIEVLEHIFPEDIDTAIANLCYLSDTIIFSSCPPTVNELTEDSERFPRDLIHPSVHEGSFWLEKFYQHGYKIDTRLTITLRGIMPWIYVVTKEHK